MDLQIPLCYGTAFLIKEFNQEIVLLCRTHGGRLMLADFRVRA